jgi:DHA3 family tetracycline resistance protein-like MFS transporter
MGEKHFRPEAEENRASWGEMGSTLKAGVRLVRARPVLWIILIIAVFEGMYSEGYDRLFAPFLIESFEFPLLNGLDTVIWWGVMSAGATVFSFMALELIKRYLDTSNYQQLVFALSIASALLVAAMFSFILAGSFYLALLAFFAVAMLRSIKSPLTAAWLNQGLDSASRATVFSMQAQADAVGQVAGGPAVGAIGKFVSIQAALVVSTIALIPAIGLYRKALKLKQPSPD